LLPFFPFPEGMLKSVLLDRLDVSLLEQKAVIEDVRPIDESAI
jgi:hypothetical protein